MPHSKDARETTPSRPMRVHCPVLDATGALPVTCTCDGEGRSPPIGWDLVPYKAQSIVVIADDPDAPHRYFVHWLAWNIPAGWNGLTPDVDPDAEELVQGLNGFGDVGYGPPCPPQGSHRYVFRVFALDTMLDLPRGADRAALERAMQGHILSQGELVTHYQRRHAAHAPQPPA